MRKQALILLLLILISCYTPSVVEPDQNTLQEKVTLYGKTYHTSGSTKITGVICSEDGQPISFASFSLVQDYKVKRGDLTDSLGRFELLNLFPGSYSVEIDHADFKTINFCCVSIKENDHFYMDTIRMKK